MSKLKVKIRMHVEVISYSYLTVYLKDQQSDIPLLFNNKKDKTLYQIVSSKTPIQLKTTLCVTNNLINKLTGLRSATRTDPLTWLKTTSQTAYSLQTLELLKSASSAEKATPTTNSNTASLSQMQKHKASALL